MEQIEFKPRWREELQAISPEGKLIFELTMGRLHVYFPDQDRWLALAPDWARKNGTFIWNRAAIGAIKIAFQ
ncbi:MAG TPA: hypothetical protein VN873_02935 [Candidatus Angelobacter sp.]|nr:hypothetical protein [Candidatus Angelobacter sp.]